MYYLISLVGIIGYSFIVVVFGFVSISKAKRGEKFSGWMTAAAVLQLISIYGNYNSGGLTNLFWTETIGSIAVWIIFDIIANNTYNKHKG